MNLFKDIVVKKKLVILIVTVASRLASSISAI